MLAPLFFGFAALLAPPSVPSLGIERYEIDARTSTIGFDGTSTLHDFSGRTHAITGDLRADRADPGRLVGGAVWIEARTLDTGNSTRDGEMRDLLGVERYPEIVFRLDSVQGTILEGRGELEARGRFTIRGVEKDRVVRFHVDPLAPGTDGPARGMRVQGEVRFDMTDHGIERPGILIAKVADQVRVWLDLTLRPVPDPGVDARVRTLEVEEEFVPRTGGLAPQRSSGTELLWTIASKRLWERRLDPVWALEDERGLASIDPRTGSARPPAGILQQAMAELSRTGSAGTTWTATADESDGLRTLRITLGDEVAARLPKWAFEPTAWGNGPAAESPRGTAADPRAR